MNTAGCQAAPTHRCRELMQRTPIDARQHALAPSDTRGGVDVRASARGGGIVATVMTLERTQDGFPFSLQLRATPESVATARRALAAYCQEHGAARETTDR